MIIRACFVATAVSFGLLLPRASLAEPTPLQPTKAWLLDYAETQCVASRPYGTPENPQIFAIRPSPYGDTFELIFASPGSGPKFAQEARGYIDFGDRRIQAWMLRYAANDPDLDIHQYRITAMEMARARTATTARLRSSTAFDVTLTLSNIPALLDGLARCTENLRQHWNVADAGTAILTPAQGDVRGLIEDQDYPEEASRRNQGGKVQFLLLVDEAGKVAGCHVVMPSNIPVLDARGCQVLRERAKFTPARDVHGKAVRSAYMTPLVHWRMQN